MDGNIYVSLEKRLIKVKDEIGDMDFIDEVNDILKEYNKRRKAGRK